MPTAEQAHQDIITQIEENRLEEAITGLLAFSVRYSPDKETAVRMRRSDWKTLEEEALMMGDTSGIRERRSALKLQLFRLADAIRKDASGAGASSVAHSPAGPSTVAVPPFSTPRGEGPANLVLAYAPEPADRSAGEQLRKSLALLLHLKRVEVFDQQKDPAGNREAAITNALNEAEVILLMLSNNFLSNLECLALQQDAFSLYQQNRAAVVPVLFNSCEWKELDIGRLQALPRNGQFVTQWGNADEAYTQISREVSELVKHIRERLDYEAGSPPRASSPKGERTSGAKPGEKPKQTYNTAGLLAIFRKGNTDGLIRQLLDVTLADGDFYDQVLLLEQRWKEVSSDERNNTASQESISVRKNKLNQDLLRLIREMEG